MAKPTKAGKSHKAEASFGNKPSDKAVNRPLSVLSVLAMSEGDADTTEQVIRADEIEDVTQLEVAGEERGELS